jgi:nicotinate-nucleotide--dimethylbenzimidazole phosphoribosyltransferase
MKIQITGLNQFTISENAQDILHIPDGWVSLKVSHCAICRTDAKMWKMGHRDLHLPRVPGHEIVAVQGDNRYVVWPGVVCGTCHYCKTDRENLCESIKIIGFHCDGGFCDTIMVPESNCLAIPEQLNSIVATFAEPAGCIINAFNRVNLKKNSRLLIYGAGTLGILTALLSLHYGAVPVIIEKNELKITKAECFTDIYGFKIVNNTDDNRFDVVINCCSDPAAFMSSIPKAAKGATIVFFSGLEKNIQIESRLFNLIHYKELNIVGSYGLTKGNMKTGLHLISQNQKSLERLIERIISPHSVPDSIPKIFEGEHYKFIISF